MLATQSIATGSHTKLITIHLLKLDGFDAVGATRNHQETEIILQAIPNLNEEVRAKQPAKPQVLDCIMNSTGLGFQVPITGVKNICHETQQLESRHQDVGFGVRSV